jgi:Family of unknown function (DUF6364)
MSGIRKASSGVGKARQGAGKRPKNLLLDPSDIARGEAYSQQHGTILSRLVGDFLRSLPLGPPARELIPAVARLRGIAATSARVTRDDYRAHLQNKYGR